MSAPEASSPEMLLIWAIEDESSFLKSMAVNGNFDKAKARESLARLSWAIEAQVAA